MFEKILGNLWRFKSQLSGLHHPCNGYLLRLGKRWVLIDPPEDLLPQTVQPFIGKEDITDIYITHLQYEHAAGAARFPRAVLHVPHGDEYLCKGEIAYRAKVARSLELDPWEPSGNYQGHLAGAMNERPLKSPTKLGTSLYPGSQVDGFQVIATPGHGKSAVTLIAEIDGTRVAFCGDLIYGKGQLWNWFDCDWDYGLETGQRALLQSARRLRDAKPDLLCPAHGPVTNEAVENINHLILNLDAVLSLREKSAPALTDFPEPREKLAGWRELTPHLFQWKEGNLVLLRADDGHALLIDAGYCSRGADAKAVEPSEFFANVKKAFKIETIEWAVVTNYQYEHWNLIPDFVRREKAKVLAMDIVASPIEDPLRYNLARAGQGPSVTRLPVDTTVKEGSVFCWKGYDLRFFRVGGASKYQAGIQLDLDGLRVLLVGDAVRGASLTAGPIYCWNDAEPEEKGQLHAIRRMSERKPDLLVGHCGAALRQPSRYLKATLSDWLGRVNVLERLNPHPSAAPFFTPFRADG